MSPTTLYAASDVCYVAVSAEGHGGCGSSHSRPVVNGAPAKGWALNCPPCEDHLRVFQKNHWSPTMSEIPETHDERVAREDFEKRGALDKDALMAAALARLTGLDLPDTLAAKMSGVRPVITAGAVTCPGGHVNRAGSAFCTECGSPVPKAGEPSLCPDGHSNDAAARFCVDCGKPVGTLPTPPSPSPVLAQGPAAPRDADAPGDRTGPAEAVALPSNTKMRSMDKSGLAALAKRSGLDSGGTREELLARLVTAANAAKGDGTGSV